MQTFAALLGALGLFALGMRLSAFFSGSETGFYRVSFLRLSIDANAGDRVAGRLLWFARNPSHFVATMLVGNNVANYLTTLAIGLAVVTLMPREAGWVEIVAVLAISPVVFLWGELIPKNLYFRAPLHFLRKESAWLVFFYRLFFVISVPLIGITKLIERWSGARQPALELVLGRSRLVQVLSHGRREGLLTGSQERLVYGVMHTAAEPVESSLAPARDVVGVADDMPVERVLEFAARNGLSHVPLRRADTPDDWYGYVRVIDLAARRQPLSATVRPMPRLDAGTSKLQVLRTLRGAADEMCAVTRNGRIAGIVSERELVEELFTSSQSAGIPRPPRQRTGEPVLQTSPSRAIVDS